MQVSNDIAGRIAVRIAKWADETPSSIDPDKAMGEMAAIIRAELQEVRLVLTELESSRWDGDPRRREDDPLCIRTRALLKKLEVSRD
jgi:hypothetical protein